MKNRAKKEDRTSRDNQTVKENEYVLVGRVLNDIQIVFYQFKTAIFCPETKKKKRKKEISLEHAFGVSFIPRCW